jgi:hypothetical protein
LRRVLTGFCQCSRPPSLCCRSCCGCAAGTSVALLLLLLLLLLVPFLLLSLSACWVSLTPCCLLLCPCLTPPPLPPVTSQAPPPLTRPMMCGWSSRAWMATSLATCTPCQQGPMGSTHTCVQHVNNIMVCGPVRKFLQGGCFSAPPSSLVLYPSTTLGPLPLRTIPCPPARTWRQLRGDSLRFL